MHSATPSAHLRRDPDLTGATWATSLEFDESQFPPTPETAADYARHVALGYSHMRRQRVVLAGLARDNGEILEATIARMERLGQLFRDYRVVIYENDSVDNTRALLQDWAARNERVTARCEDRTDPVNQPTRCLSRAARMAFYRSQCQQVVRERFADFDGVILIDTDLIGGWSLDGIAHSFAHDSWDFIGAYGIIYRRSGLRPNVICHYDAWAYRVDEAFTPLSTKRVNSILFERGQPLQPVTSCFGGLGIYRMPAYLAGHYDGSDIEHVTFHRDLRQRGFHRMFLNPNLIALYGRKHRTWDARIAWLLRASHRLTGYGTIDWHFASPTTAPRVTGPPTRQFAQRAA